jgi:RNA polymerase sigma factor (sigma-70 family)
VIERGDTSLIPTRGSTALLTASEEVELAKAVEAGCLAWEALERKSPLSVSAHADLEELVVAGRAAFDRFVEANVRLAASLAFRHAGRVPEGQLPDLVQAGNIALIQAVQRFDYALGYKFSTYASWWIKKAISDELLNQRAIRIGHRIALRMTQIAKVEAEIQAAFGRSPSDEEVLEGTGLTEKQLAEARTLSSEPSSLNQTIDENGVVELGTLLPSDQAPEHDNALIESDRQRSVRVALATLPPQHSRILALRYGLLGADPRTQTDTASDMGIAIDLERKLERDALARLRHPARSHLLADLL